jgi:hypothetical protein
MERHEMRNYEPHTIFAKINAIIEVIKKNTKKIIQQIIQMLLQLFYHVCAFFSQKHDEIAA